MIARIKALLHRVMEFNRHHQELIGWSIVAVVGFFFAYSVFGGWDRTSVTDMLSKVLDISIKAIGATLALGLTYLAITRHRRRLSKEESDNLGQRLMESKNGPLIVHLANQVGALCLVAMLLLYFS